MIRLRTIPLLYRQKDVQKINRCTKRFFNKTLSRLTASRGLRQSYDFGVTDVPLLGTTIGKLMELRAETDGGRQAYVSTAQRVKLTHEELLEQSDRMAAGLMSLGIQRGDRVGIWSPNCIEWAITQYATARAGIILVNVNPAYRVSELEFAMRKVGVKALIVAEAFKTSDYYRMLMDMVPELEHSDPGRLRADNLPELSHVIMISDKNLPGAFRFNDVMDMGNSTLRGQIRDLQKDLQFDDPINIQFTSGTTGLPKGATLSHHNILNNAVYVGKNMHYDTSSRICVPVPMYHCFGMVVGSLMSPVFGSTVVLPSPTVDPVATLQAIQEEKCTALYGTPTMFIDVLEVPDLASYDVSSLFTGIMAGSPCPIEVLMQCIEKLNMKDVTICYGTTENSPVTFQTRMTDPLELRVGTVGQVLGNTEAKIMDGNNRIVPTGDTGELCIRGSCVMLGYWHDEEKTAEVITNDRWYKTGDLATMDENGYVTIVGRSKDMIIRGGENIYPVEIEQFLYKHPKISDVQIVGVYDKRMGEETCAWIKLKEDETATVEEIKEFCKGQIAHFKIPRYIQFVQEFPMTVTGKIQKYLIRQAAEKELKLRD